MVLTSQSQLKKIDQTAAQTGKELERLIARFYNQYLSEPGLSDVEQRKQINQALSQNEREKLRNSSPGPAVEQLLRNPWASRKDLLMAEIDDTIDLYYKSVDLKSLPKAAYETFVRERDTASRRTRDAARVSLTWSLDAGAPFSQNSVKRVFEQAGKDLTGITAKYLPLESFTGKAAQEKLYRFETNSDNPCKVCVKLRGKIFTDDEAEEIRARLPLHPNCRCRLIEVGGPEDKPIVAWDDNKVIEAIQNLFSIPGQWWNYQLSLQENMRKSWNDPSFQSILSTLDWLSLGIPSNLWNDHKERVNRMIASEWVFRDENGKFTLKENLIYNFVNTLSAGVPDAIDGALFPKEAFSSQNWVDMISTALLVGGAVKVAGVKGRQISQGTAAIKNPKGKPIKTTPAEEVNNWWKTEKAYSNPPYKPGSVVTQIELAEKDMFVRVFDGELSFKKGGWVMRAEDIKNLTPKQIQDLYALPSMPKYICDVELPAGTQLRTGIANEVVGWGKGGGIQFDLMGKNVGDFTNVRPLQ